MAWSCSCSVSSSSSSSSLSSSGSGRPRDTGRRFTGEGDTELRSRCCRYFRRPDGELKSASWGDLGGQFGGSRGAAILLAFRPYTNENAIVIPLAFGLSLTIIVVMVLNSNPPMRPCQRRDRFRIYYRGLSNIRSEGDNVRDSSVQR